MARLKSGAPFLYDDNSEDILGIRDQDGSEFYFARGVVAAERFGVRADGTTDNTLAMQAAINAIVSTGGTLVLPAGVIRITAPLTIGFGQGWRIVGQGRERTYIRQATSNTQIFRLTADLSHSWRIEGIGFSWATQQAGAGANPNAVAIYFDSGNSTTIFNFVLQDVLFEQGYRGLAINPAATQLAVWGVTLRDIWAKGTLTGAMLRLQCASAVGQPNINLDNVYLDCTSATEPSIQIVAGTGVNLRCVEFNLGTYNTNVQMDIGSSTAVSLINCRSETPTVSTAGTKTLWDFPASDVVLVGCQFAGPVCSGGGVLRAINAGSGGRISILGLECNGTRGDGGSLLAFVGDNIELAANVIAIGNWLKDPRSILGFVRMPSIDPARMVGDATRTRTDANVTLTTADYRFQYFNETLTANRTCTLPSTGLVDGMEFHIVRYAGTPGAFTLQVIDPVSSKNYTIASGARGFARYRAVGSGEWLLIEAGTFP